MDPCEVLITLWLGVWRGVSGSFLRWGAFHDVPQGGVEARPLGWGDGREAIVDGRVPGNGDLPGDLNAGGRCPRNTHAPVALGDGPDDEAVPLQAVEQRHQ